MNLNERVLFLEQECEALFEAKKRAHGLILKLAQELYKTKNVVLSEGEDLEISILDDESYEKLVAEIEYENSDLED